MNRNLSNLALFSFIYVNPHPPPSHPLWHWYRICGPFAVLMSYLSELHGLKHRARVLMSVGLFFSLANIILPGLAWTVLPQSWDFVILEGVLGTYYHNYILSLITYTRRLTDDGSVSFKMSLQKSTHGRYSWRCAHCQLSAAVSWSYSYLRVRNF